MVLSVLRGCTSRIPARNSAPGRSRRCAVRTLAMSTEAKTACTVTAEWLKERLGQPNVKVLDGSWYMPVHARDWKAEFKARRIPGARYFDLDGITATNTDLPHMLPTEGAFSAAMDALGLSPTDTIVVYDGLGCFSAPRVWWTLKVFGHKEVYVLEGGMPAWEAVSGPLDTSPVDDQQMTLPTTRAREPNAQGTYPAKLDTSKVRSSSQMLANVSASNREQVVDARSQGRFVGTEPEPRPGLKGGHIPGARNVPFPTVLSSWRLKPDSDLQSVFSQAGIDLSQPVVGSCGSGVTACVLALAIHKATGGKTLIPVYDGSWSEWGALDNVPISTDPDK